MTRRRPKRSDSPPMMGENTNCMSAQSVPNRPSTLAARAVSPPRKPSTMRGSTGMMMPRARMSSSRVMKMKTSAARRGCAAGAGAVMAWTS